MSKMFAWCERKRDYKSAAGSNSIDNDESDNKLSEHVSMTGMHLLTLKELSAGQIEHLLWSALDMKQAKANAAAATTNERGSKSTPTSSYRMLADVMSGKMVVAVFQKKSTRTRLAFESAAHRLGANLVFCNQADLHLGAGESIRDTALVMSRMCDAITARVYDHALLDELARDAQVPVINALSDRFHPLQALADLMVVYERFGRLRGLNIAWLGDGNNVLASLMIAAAKMGMNLVAACPRGYEPCAQVLAYARELAAANDCSVEVIESPADAVRNAHVVVTDTWISMGQEKETEARLAAFAGYQVNRELMAHATQPDWVFLHCLPRKSDEVTDDVFYDERRSLVFDEAEDRKWTTMAVLANLLTGYSPTMIKTRHDFVSVKPLIN